MGTSKILIDGVGIDLTNDTVAENKMLSGTKAHDSNGDSVTGIIPSKAAATYMPTASDQTIDAGQYLSGAQTVKGDANLIAGNIKQGVSIFGVAGSLTPGITPSGTKSITANGTYDVTEYASAAVNVAGEVVENATILGYPKHELTPTWDGVNAFASNTVIDFTMNEITHIGWLNETYTDIRNKAIGNSSGSTFAVQYPNLKRVELRCKVRVSETTGRIFSRANCPLCSEIVLGGIGFPVYGMQSTEGAYNTTFANNLTLTLYVNANSIADIPSNIKNAQPWGFTTATIIYRNSTTGEVLT